MAVTDDLERRRLPAPDLPYRPLVPRLATPPIGLIGCGGITKHHLTAYRRAGYEVVALCDLDRDRAEERRREFYPKAALYTRHEELLDRDDIAVVDIATHPAERVKVIRDALDAGKHVLSQKPFVLDLDIGEELVELADRQGVELAVNQNGRWAPHISYLRTAVAEGLLGELVSVELSANFDHSWIVDTPFDRIDEVVLYDYAIHWFDALTCYAGGEAASWTVASKARARGQVVRPPMLAHVLVDYPELLATLAFNGAAGPGTHDRTVLVGTEATAVSSGPDVSDQTVEIVTATGVMTPELEGAWYDDGFHGTMAELLCAIEDGRTPTHHARGNLTSLALAFAAIESARTGGPTRPGEVRRIPDEIGTP